MISFAISIPVGAYHPFLPFCLSSLLAQDANVEIALMDASGDPRVRELADQYDTEIVYRRHAPDDGQSAGILEGWENTQGEVLGWLNADDVLYPHALTRVLPLFENGADVVCGNSTVVNENGATIGYHWGVDRPGPQLLSTNTISQPSCFFRRNACDEVGGLNPDLHYTMDWDLWIRLYNNGAKFEFVQDALSQVMWGRNTKTASFNQRRRDEIQALVTEHSPQEKRKNILRSFARESRIDRLPAAFLRTLAGNVLARGRPQVLGFSGAGEISSGAEISLVHYKENPARGLRIDLADVTSVDKVLLNGEPRDFELRRGALFVWQVTPQATVVDLKFILKANRRGRFKNATWV